MHVLHRPHDLRRAIVVALTAAVLAIAVTVAINGGLSALSSTQASTGAPIPHTAGAPALRPLISRPPAYRPFTGPFTGSLGLPWAVAPR